MTQKNILFEDSAVKEVLKVLRSKFNYAWHTYKLINKNRYAIVKGWGSENIAILLKSDFFNTFGEKFSGLGEKGIGDSINVGSLKQFISQEVRYIYVMFRDGKIYTISLFDFLCKSHKWVQKEGTEVRSISIHHYKRLN